MSAGAIGGRFSFLPRSTPTPYPARPCGPSPPSRQWGGERAFAPAETFLHERRIASRGRRRVDRHVIDLVALSGAGFVAGVMNAMAGGGTFVTIPALVWAGTPSLLANAT